MLIGVCVFAALWIANQFVGWLYLTQSEDQFLKQSSYVEALSKASEVKLQVMEFFTGHGRFPVDNAELGVAAPATYQNGNIKSLGIGPNGLIAVTLSEKIGEDAFVALKPSANLTKSGSVLNWQCYTNGIDFVPLAHEPSCQSLSEGQSLATLKKEVLPEASLENLLNAIYARREGLVRSLIAQGVNVNAVGRLGETPLSAAIERGSRAIVEVLVSAGADVNQLREKDDNKTMLMYAAEQRDASAADVRVLLAAGAEINDLDSQGRSALIYAAKTGSSLIVHVLLEAGADINITDNSGNKAVNYAADLGYNSSVYQKLLAAQERQREFVYRPPDYD